MPAPTLTSPPTAPARTDTPAVFVTRADAFVAWLETFVSEMEESITYFETELGVDVAAAVAAVIDSAPGTLDTLNELAAALGDDPNFATTMTNALANKQGLDATLTALAGLTVAADKLVYATDADAFSTTDFTSVARTLLAQTTQALMRTAGLGFSANASSFVAAADYAAMKLLLSLVKGDVGLGNVDNTADTAKPVSTAQQTALDLKANLASPALTGTPTAPTASPGTNSTQVATTAYADAKVADAINDGTTAIAPSQNAVFDALALKAPLVSPSFTTPTLGVASATSLALSGAITGATTGAFSGQVTTTKVGVSANNAFDFTQSSSSQIKVLANGTNCMNFVSNRLALASDIRLAWTNTAGDGSAGTDLYLTRSAAATLRQGLADAASPVAQTTEVQSVLTGTTNTAGAVWTFKDSAGSGDQGSGGYDFQVAPAGSSGSTKNSHSSAFSIASTKLVTFGAGIVLGGPSQLKSYTVGTVPSAVTYARGLIWVSNEAGGATAAYSDGTNWRRFYDAAIIS